jgi:cell division protease FtsH
MQMPEEEKYLMTKDEILAEIVILLAGRSAEEVVFNQITTGAANDIERATSLARSMVSQYGMSDSFDMMALESTQNRYLDGRPVTTCGDITVAQLDKEVLGVIKSCHQKAIDIIKTNREALDKISDYLITKETITGEEFMKILNEVDGVEVKEAVKEAVTEEAKTEEVKIEETKTEETKTEETTDEKGELN